MTLLDNLSRSTLQKWCHFDFYDAAASALQGPYHHDDGSTSTYQSRHIRPHKHYHNVHSNQQRYFHDEHLLWVTSNINQDILVVASEWRVDVIVERGRVPFGVVLLAFALLLYCCSCCFVCDCRRHHHRGEKRIAFVSSSSCSQLVRPSSIRQKKLYCTNSPSTTIL